MKMSIKDLFSLSGHGRARIKALEEHSEYVRSIACKVTKSTNLPRSSPTKPGDRTGVGGAQLADLSRKLDDERIQFIAVLDTLYRVISEVHTPLYRTILEYRYIEGMGFEAIAEKLSYSFRHITRLYSAAVAFLETLYPEGVEVDDKFNTYIGG